MPYVKGAFRSERSRQIARSGSLSGKSLQPRPWWPEGICQKIDKIVWMVYCLGEQGEDWHQFTAYDASGQVLGVHRVEGF
jgi:hypothetical protein